jgi:lysophospholipase L1-like esterase
VIDQQFPDLEEPMTMTDVDCVVVLGDSTSAGFGTGGRGYAVLVGEALGASRVENLSQFGRTTKLMFEEDLARVAAIRPDMIIVQAGMGDSLPHPGQRIQRMLEHFVPSTWHGVDGLERRAYFSGTRRQRVRQWAVAESKTTLKRVLIAVTGGFTRSNPDEFRGYLDQLLDALEPMCPIVISVGLFDLDQHIFPKQHRLNLPFRRQRDQVLAEHPRVIRVEIDHKLHRWDDFLGDHCHLNASGHASVAEEVLLALQAELPGFADERGMRGSVPMRG